MPAKYDQHFLVDESAADAIVDAAGISRGEPVVEIGPGRGILTRRLLEAGARLTAVEVDPRLIPVLKRDFEPLGISLVHADWLRLDLGLLPPEAKVVSNLPYSVAAPILQKMLRWGGWKRAVLMFQKEVADRIRAVPGSRDFSPLSLSVQIKALAREVLVLGPDAFRPRPRVDSAVLRLDPLERSRLPDELSEPAFFRVVRTAFSQRRKMAAKILASAFRLPRTDVEAALRDAGVPEAARAETIPLEAFIELALWIQNRLPRQQF